MRTRLLSQGGRRASTAARRSGRRGGAKPQSKRRKHVQSDPPRSPPPQAFPLWSRILLFLIITVLLRILWPNVSKYYFSLLLTLADAFAPVFGLEITSLQPMGDLVVVGFERGGVAAAMQLQRGLANYLPFNLLLFLGLVLGMSFHRLRANIKHAVWALVVCCLILAGSHIAWLLTSILTSSYRTLPPKGVRLMTTMWDTTGPLLALLLWVGAFTDLPRRLLSREPATNG